MNACINKLTGSRRRVSLDGRRTAARKMEVYLEDGYAGRRCGEDITYSL